MKAIHVQLTITLDESAARPLAELLAPALKQAGFIPHESNEESKARLRPNPNFCGQKLPEDQGLLVDSREAAKLLRISPRTLWKMQTSGEMPPPIRIGRAVRWSLEVLKKWVESGCPVDSKWQAERP